MRIIVVTGLSGSGKSTAIRSYEDRSFFCVDNLPVVLIPGLVKAVSKTELNYNAVVLGIDARERFSLKDFKQVAKSLTASGHKVEVVFLEAGEQILVRRFSETRRRHPLAGIDIRAALAKESKLLAPLRERATWIIDTSTMTVHELKSIISKSIDGNDGGRNLSITLLSFGFKYGVPLEADLMYDVRFLPNPHFVEELKPKTGLDQEVFDYVFAHDQSHETVKKIEDFLSFSIPLFEQEGKAYLTVAIGCTGGKHRSISLVRAVQDYLNKNMPDYNVSVRHRDITKNRTK